MRTIHEVVESDSTTLVDLNDQGAPYYDTYSVNWRPGQLEVASYADQFPALAYPVDPPFTLEVDFTQVDRHLRWEVSGGASFDGVMDLGPYLSQSLTQAWNRTSASLTYLEWSYAYLSPAAEPELDLRPKRFRSVFF